MILVWILVFISSEFEVIQVVRLVRLGLVGGYVWQDLTVFLTIFFVSLQNKQIIMLRKGCWMKNFFS